MGRRSEPVTVVDATADRDALRPLLEEYHDWLRTEHREWTDRTAAADVALASEADIADGAADDLRTLVDPAVDSGAFLAGDAEEPAGCVLYYGVSGEMAEMKRLYVPPPAAATVSDGRSWRRSSMRRPRAGAPRPDDSAVEPGRTRALRRLRLRIRPAVSRDEAPGTPPRRGAVHDPRPREPSPLGVSRRDSATSRGLRTESPRGDCPTRNP
jgi:hypothetical protein